MTNFIATLQQVQGYCAEVRTATCPLAPILGPIGENNMEEEVPLAIKDRLPRGNAMVDFRHRFTQSNSLLLAVETLPSQLCVKQDADPQRPPNLQTLTSLLPAR